MGNCDLLWALQLADGREPCSLWDSDKPHCSRGKLCAALSCGQLFAYTFVKGEYIMEEKKKEPKYLDLSAHAEVNLEELLERIIPPIRTGLPEKEADDNDDNS